MQHEPRFFTAKAAAAWLREHGVQCSLSSLNRYASEGTGPAFHKDNVRRIYRREDLEAYATARLGEPVHSVAEHKARRLHEPKTGLIKAREAHDKIRRLKAVR